MKFLVLKFLCYTVTCLSVCNDLIGSSSRQVLEELVLQDLPFHAGSQSQNWKSSGVLVVLPLVSLIIPDQVRSLRKKSVKYNNHNQEP